MANLHQVLNIALYITDFFEKKICGEYDHRMKNVIVTSAAREVSALAFALDPAESITINRSRHQTTREQRAVISEG